MQERATGNQEQSLKHSLNQLRICVVEQVINVKKECPLGLFLLCPAHFPCRPGSSAARPLAPGWRRSVSIVIDGLKELVPVPTRACDSLFSSLIVFCSITKWLFEVEMKWKCQVGDGRMGGRETWEGAATLCAKGVGVRGKMSWWGWMSAGRGLSQPCPGCLFVLWRVGWGTSDGQYFQVNNDSTFSISLNGQLGKQWT